MSLMNSFLDNLKRNLNEYNENNEKKVSVPFIISILSQSFNENEKDYDFLLNDLKIYNDYQININKSLNDYNGIIEVEIVLFRTYESIEDYKPNSSYLLKFYKDIRHYRYCECTEKDEDYRVDKNCCGHGCDWSAPAVSIDKIININNFKWNGDEHDFWEFEDDFYTSNEELKKKKEEKEKIERIKELQKTIELAQKELDKLTK